MWPICCPWSPISVLDISCKVDEIYENLKHWNIDGLDYIDCWSLHKPQLKLWPWGYFITEIETIWQAVQISERSVAGCKVKRGLEPSECRGAVTDGGRAASVTAQPPHSHAGDRGVFVVWNYFYATNNQMWSGARKKRGKIHLRSRYNRVWSPNSRSFSSAFCSLALGVELKLVLQLTISVNY